MRHNRPLTELDAMLTADQRRTVTVDQHLHFQKSLATDPTGRDEIDRELDDSIQIDPYAGDPPSKRKDGELARVLSILDSLDAERWNG